MSGLLLLGIAPAAVGQAKEKPTIVCATLNSAGTGYIYRYAVAPRRCLIQAIGRSGYQIGPLHWKWRVKRANGRGRVKTVDGRERIRVTFSKPRDRCEGSRFTKVHIVFPHRPRFNSRSDLRTCV